jgi:predicted membrane-bound spermidine synthase
VALLYASNTLGAVCGAVAAGFALLPALGLNATVVTGVIINLSIFGFIATMRRRHGADIRTTESETGTTQIGFFDACVAPWFSKGTRSSALQTCFTAQPAWILPVMLLSGAVALVYEILWTRMLTHTLGSGLTAYATMLAAFLVGIAAGSGFASGFARERERATTAFIAAQAGIAGLSILAFSWLAPMAMVPASHGQAQLTLYAAAVMLPAAIFLGASFPLAVRILARNAAQAGGSTARVFAWNTVGAVAGSLLAAFVLLPALGFEGTIKLVAAANFSLALWVAVCVARRRLITIGVTATGLLATVLVYAPSRPDAVVTSTAFPISYHTDPEEVFYAVGRSATVLMLEENGYFYLRSNGLPEASILAKGSPPVQDPEKWLTALPVAARPDAQTMLLIGFGGGVALEGVPPSISDIDVIELEPEVINANRAIATQRNNDPLEDARVNIVNNDARNALRLTSKRYDIVVSQPSHPWTSAAAHLYTRDFLGEAKARMNDDGVFVQWINSEFIDEPLLRTLAATLRSEFEHVRLYQPGDQVLVFLASDTEMTPEQQLARSGDPITDDIMHYSRMGMNGVEDLLTALIMDEAGVAEFAEDARISTDDNLLMATRSRNRADGLVREDLAELFAPYDPLVTRGSWIYTRLFDSVDFGYMTRNLLRLGQHERAIAMSEAHPDESTRLIVLGLLYAARGQPDQAAAAYERALALRPDNAQARYLLIEPSIPAISQRRAEPSVSALAEGLPASAGAVIFGWEAAANQDWNALSQLDSVLGRAAVTDAWYPEVARLRSEWRGQVRQDIESFAFDALRLVDRAILIRPQLNFYLLRAAIGIALGDGSIAIESSRQAVRLVRATLDRLAATGERVAARDLLVMQQNLNAIVTNLRGELVATEQRRAELVRAQANQILRYVNSVLEELQAAAEAENAQE